MSLTTPDITPAQILAGLSFVLTEAVAGGLLSVGREQLILQVAGIVLPGVLMVADFVIRHGRSKINVALIEHETERLLGLFHSSDVPSKPAVPVGDPTAPVTAASTV